MAGICVNVRFLDRDKVPLVFINNVDILQQIHLKGLVETRLVNNLPSNKQDGEDTNHGVPRESQHQWQKSLTKV
jgi:hypothetical protein